MIHVCQKPQMRLPPASCLSLFHNIKSLLNLIREIVPSIIMTYHSVSPFSAIQHTPRVPPKLDSEELHFHLTPSFLNLCLRSAPPLSVQPNTQPPLFKTSPPRRPLLVRWILNPAPRSPLNKRSANPPQHHPLNSQHQDEEQIIKHSTNIIAIYNISKIQNWIFSTYLRRLSKRSLEKRRFPKRSYVLYVNVRCREPENEIRKS
jgi:hypothetical protein